MLSMLLNITTEVNFDTAGKTKKPLKYIDSLINTV